MRAAEAGLTLGRSTGNAEDSRGQQGGGKVMRLVEPTTKRQLPQFSLGLLLSVVTAISLTGAIAKWVHSTHLRTVAQSQYEFAQQMRFNQDRLTALRMNQSFEAFLRENRIERPAQ